MNRRQFLRKSGGAAATTALVSLSPSLLAQRQAAGSVMSIDLNFPKLGVACVQTDAIRLAAVNGFQSVSADTSQIARMTGGQLDTLDALRRESGLEWGTCGLPVDFRNDDTTFQAGLTRLKEVGPKLRRLGLARMTTWISPSHDELTYLQNFQRCSGRLKQLDPILAGFEIRLGLEYVGTQLLRFNRKHPFIHTSAEVLELIEATGGTQFGLILDSWHWWTSGEASSDLTQLHRSQIVSVEINDAPAGIEREQQQDNRRGLPVTTEVLPLKAFLSAVQETGFTGPLMVEPFHAPLREKSPEVVAAEVYQSLQRAVSLLD